MLIRSRVLTVVELELGVRVFEKVNIFFSTFQFQRYGVWSKTMNNIFLRVNSLMWKRIILLFV